MRRSFRKALLWQVVGLGLYLLGMLVFLVVALGAYMAPPENSFANFSGGHMAALLVSIALIVSGRVVSYKLGGESTVAGGLSQRIRPEPKQNKLQELGYKMPPDPSESESDGLDFSYEDGELKTVCGECGAENDPDFKFCGNCSSELPD